MTRLLHQVNAAQKSREARAQLEAAKARHHKLIEARRTVEALQSALEAGQAQVHHCCFTSRCELDVRHELVPQCAFLFWLLHT